MEVRTLFVHALFYGVFVVGLGGVLEGAAEAGTCHVCALWCRGSRCVLEEFCGWCDSFLGKYGSEKWLLVKAATFCEWWWKFG